MRSPALAPWCLGLALVAASAPAASARDADAFHLTLGGAVTTEDGVAVGSDLASSFKGARPPAFGLDLGLAIPLPGFELGTQVSVVTSGSTPGVGTTQRLYAQSRWTAYFRWNYLELDDFDIYMGLGIGVATTRLSDFVRFELGREAGADLTAVTRSFSGLAVDLETGTRIPLADGLRLALSVAAHASSGDISVGGETRSVLIFPTRFHAGLEWPL
jgi:hypothetical protein